MGMRSRGILSMEWYQFFQLRQCFIYWLRQKSSSAELFTNFLSCLSLGIMELGLMEVSTSEPLQKCSHWSDGSQGAQCTRESFFHFWAPDCSILVCLERYLQREIYLRIVCSNLDLCPHSVPQYLSNPRKVIWSLFTFSFLWCRTGQITS